MEFTKEIAITSGLNDSVVSIYVWDVQTGAMLMTYRGDCAVPPVGLSLLAGQYMVAALQAKPFLRAWPINSQHSLGSLRLVCPGRVSHAQASPDACYIALTVAEKLHVYQVASGLLVGSGVRHFQPIRVLRWTMDGAEVVCGGEDGLVTVWPLTSATQGTAEPRLVLADHTLTVTDLTVTSGSRPRLLTVSADHTCKIYDLREGTILVSLVFDKTLTAVATSTLETEVFVGTESGDILQFSLLSVPRQLEYHLTTEEAAPLFSGHSKAVRSLHVSAEGTLLMSGSADGTVKLWPIGSRSQQCLRTFTHKGPVTNAFFAPKPKQMFDNELKPDVVLSSFQSANNEKTDFIEVITEQSLTLCDSSIRDSSVILAQTYVSGSSTDRVKSLQMEIDLLRSINSNLYKFTVDKIITGNTFKPHVPKAVAVEVPKTKPKKKKKKKNSSNILPDNVKSKPSLLSQSNNNSNHSSVVVSINGLSKTKKKRRRKNKNKNVNNVE